MAPEIHRQKTGAGAYTDKPFIGAILSEPQGVMKSTALACVLYLLAFIPACMRVCVRTCVG